MKKLLTIFLMIALLSIHTCAAPKKVSLEINGKSKSLTTANVLVNYEVLKSEFSPYISGGRTFVPIRELTEGLGATVTWNNDEKTAHIELGSTVVVLKINNAGVVVNGKKLDLDENAIPRMATYLEKGKETKTMVPLRFLSETFGFQVSWDNKTKTATIHGSVAVAISDDVKKTEEKMVEPILKKAASIDTTKDNEDKEMKAESLNSSTDSENEKSATESMKEKKERVITKTITAEGPVTVVLDAGHGGKDSGALAKDGKTTEAELNLAVTTSLARKLRSEGIEVIETRTTDEFIALKKRAQIAEDANAEIFVSIHFNSASSQKASGIEVLYAPENKVEIKEAEQIHLAKCILQEVLKETGSSSRGVKARPDLVVLRRTSMPAALVELGFLSNDKDLSNILDPVYFESLVEGVNKGIQKYIDEYVK